MSQGETALAFGNHASKVFAVHRFPASALAILLLSLSVIAQQSTSSSSQEQLQEQPSRPSSGQSPGSLGPQMPAAGTGLPIGGPPSPGTITRGRQVPGAAKAVAAPPALSLSQAIEVAIQNNLATLLAKERRNEARGFEKELGGDLWKPRPAGDRIILYRLLASICLLCVPATLLFERARRKPGAVAMH